MILSGDRSAEMHEGGGSTIATLRPFDRTANHADPARAPLFYPIDWPQLSAVIRFRRAKGRCEGCGRPHGQIVWHFGDGRWWDAQAGSWHDGAGRVVCLAVGEDDVLASIRTTRVVLAAAHRNHDTADNRGVNLMAVCQRCHMNHDRPEHKTASMADPIPAEGVGRPVRRTLPVG